jgi:hypothetical protein
MINKSLASYGNRNFTTIHFQISSTRTPTQDNRIHSTPSHPISLRSILIGCYSAVLVSYRSAQSNPTRKVFRLQFFCSFLVSHTSAACPSQLIFLDLVVLIISGKECKVWSFSLCNFLHHLVSSSFLCPNTLGRAMAQAVSRRPLTTEARVRSQVKSM